MFLNGLLWGLGWVVGTGLAITFLLGFAVLGEFVKELTARYMPSPKPKKQPQAPITHSARLLFFVRFPAASEERTEMRERKTKYFS